MLNFFKRKTNEEASIVDLNSLIADILKNRNYVFTANDLSGIEAYENIKKLTATAQKEVIIDLIDFITNYIRRNSKSGYSYSSSDPTLVGFALLNGLLRRRLDYTEDEWITLFSKFKDSADKISNNEFFYFSFSQYPINYAIQQIEYRLKDDKPSENLKSFIQNALTWKEFQNNEGANHFGSDLPKATKKLRGLIMDENEPRAFRLTTEDIGKEVNQIFDSIKHSIIEFNQVFHLAFAASGSKPTKSFSNQIKNLSDKIGTETFKKTIYQLIDIAIEHEPSIKTINNNYAGTTYTYTESFYLSQPSQQFIKGLVWSLERFSDKQTIDILSRLCEKSYTKIPGKGPSAASVGNACVYVLGNMRGKDGLGALSRIKLRVRQNSLKKTINKYLIQGAKKYNVSVEELKEMAVPEYQLEKGSKRVQFEEYTLKIFIANSKINQQWLKPDGSPIKSVPGTVKNSASLTRKLKAERKEIKEIQKVYSAQKQRIDNQFILNRSWDWLSFKKHYLDHGLVYPITTRLIWTFSKNEQFAEGILLNDQWYTVEHDRIDWIDEQTKVQLWHPVNASESSIVNWREKMMELEWKQPIKQAFREIYLLTEAEINTGTYSNRMASHILKQHQFNSLASIRDWKYTLMGAFDNGIDNQTCHKYLPEYKITAEYWIDELDEDHNINDTGIWLYVATDQVRFKDELGQLMNLIDVPKFVFSEIMRDVDLFVGVCSVGNDPQWMDNNGERQINRDYWTSYSFGDLSEIAKTRKTILERLLPRLKKIRDKAHIDGKFLVIEGKIRTYKIHIGSGNILMEPNDQYLCIVPSRSADATSHSFFIPFEGDKGLSIVLSKALLLAEDDKISDSTITSQIRR